MLCLYIYIFYILYCVKQDAFSRFTFKPSYCNNLNGGKGATPFDLKSGDEYTLITDKGITPFDIMLPKD